MAKHTGKGSGKPAPEVVLSDEDTYQPQPDPNSPKRPTKYTKEVGDAICADIINGMSLRSALKPLDRPNPLYWYEWLRENEDLAKQYAQSCEERSEAFGEDILEIADNSTNDWMTVNGHAAVNREAVERSKLRVDVRKWHMSKMKPRKYGEKLDMTTNGKDLPAPIMRLDDVNKKTD